MIDGLVSAADRWADWQVHSWDGFSLVLIADNDLTYHHHVTATFEDVDYVACPAEFSWPRFREATVDERSRHEVLLDPGEPRQLIAFDAESINGRLTCFAVARNVTVSEGLVLHTESR